VFTYGYNYLYYPLYSRGLQADVNHITEHLNAHLMQWLEPRRTVVTCHDLMHFMQPTLFSVPKLPFVSQWLLDRSLAFLPRAARVIADSESTRQDILQHTQCDPEQVSVVYLGLDARFQTSSDVCGLRAFREKHGLDSSRLLLHVGIPNRTRIYLPCSLC